MYINTQKSLIILLETNMLYEHALTIALYGGILTSVVYPLGIYHTNRRAIGLSRSENGFMTLQ